MVVDLSLVDCTDVASWLQVGLVAAMSGSVTELVVCSVVAVVGLLYDTDVTSRLVVDSAVVALMSLVDCMVGHGCKTSARQNTWHAFCKSTSVNIFKERIYYCYDILQGSSLRRNYTQTKIEHVFCVNSKLSIIFGKMI